MALIGGVEVMSENRIALLADPARGLGVVVVFFAVLILGVAFTYSAGLLQLPAP